MPSLTHHPSVASSGSRAIYKGLHVGDSGSAKTGALAALVDDGYKLRCLDFEDGLDPIAGYAKKQELIANVSYHTLKDEFKLVGNYVAIKKAPSFQRAMALLNDWKDDDAPDGTYGAVQSWGDDVILVIDTLGSMSRACFNMVLAANGAFGPSGSRGGPEQSHYGTAQDSIERLLDMLTTPEVVPCHVIINAHWSWQNDAQGLGRPYPRTIGKALDPKVGEKFNNMLGFSTTAVGKKINTQRDGTIGLKTSRPLKPSYEVGTGLSEIFKEVVGPPPLV